MPAGFQILTVSQLCRYVKSLLAEQKVLENIMVKGEVSNLSYKQMSGHLYFSIRDEGGLIRCAMFQRYVKNLAELPREGTAVVVRGAAGLYERDGSFQIIVYDVQTLGAGRGRQDLEALKQRLLEEGLFEEKHKRPLPPFPNTVGIVTSAEGAALQDIIRAFRRRRFCGRLLVYPCLVQGESAPESVRCALEHLEDEGLCEAVIIARGGGSSEDLSAFNDEALARAVYQCPVPVVSAVGHEVDYTILDFVADRRAATPTAAGELLAPDKEALESRVIELRRTIRHLAGEQVRQKKFQLQQSVRLLSANSPTYRLEKNRQKLLYLVKLLNEAQRQKLQSLRGRSMHLLRQLELLNPAAVMRKGYSIAMLDGAALTTVDNARVGGELRTILADGEMISTIRSYYKSEEKDGTESTH